MLSSSSLQLLEKTESSVLKELGYFFTTVIDLWTTRTWTAQVHLYIYFFPQICITELWVLRLVGSEDAEPQIWMAKCKVTWIIDCMRCCCSRLKHIYFRVCPWNLLIVTLAEWISIVLLEQQITRYEQSRGCASVKWQEQRGSSSRQRKAGTSRLIENWVCWVLEVDKERWETVRFSSIYLMVTFAHYALITIKLALQRGGTHHAPTPWHFRSRLNKVKNPSSLQEGGAGMKNQEINPKRLPPQWMLCPFIFTSHITSLPKTHREATHLCLATLPLNEYKVLLNPHSAFLTSISLLNSSCDETKTYSNSFTMTYDPIWSNVLNILTFLTYLPPNKFRMRSFWSWTNFGIFQRAPGRSQRGCF